MLSKSLDLVLALNIPAVELTADLFADGIGCEQFVKDR